MPPEPQRPTAVLAAVQRPGVPDAEHQASLDELRRLVQTLGLEVVGAVSQKRRNLAPGSVVGKGKLRELAAWTGGTGLVPKGPPKKGRADEAVGLDDDEEDDEDFDGLFGPGPSGPRASVVVVDHELSPMQLRNLARATGAEVLDRSGVIVEIFHRHASSREARLQVEIARLTYLAPRLREAGASERSGAGVGAKGAGESAVELDRRKIRNRLSELRKELEDIEGEQRVRRSRRGEQLRVALVGYTNAGKSSLMRALTGSDVLVQDKLFATLDTTVRILQPETRPRILVSDTVGFIRKLPHDLVASFRSTLDEALEASLLLYVVDASDPDFRAQLEVTREVLADIGAADVPSLLVLNKSDRLDPAQARSLEEEFPGALLVSAKDPDGVAQVRTAILSEFGQAMGEAELLVPYGQRQVIGEIHTRTSVLAEEYTDEGVRFRVRGPTATLRRLQALLGSEGEG